MLTEYLKATGANDKDFAARAGVSTASVSLWKRGLSRPGYDSALLLQSATGGAVPYLAWQHQADAPAPPPKVKPAPTTKRRNPRKRATGRAA